MDKDLTPDPSIFLLVLYYYVIEAKIIFYVELLCGNCLYLNNSLKITDFYYILRSYIDNAYGRL